LNGIATAEALATIAAIIVNGGTWKGDTFLSPETIAEGEHIDPVEGIKLDKLIQLPSVLSDGGWGDYIHDRATSETRGALSFGGTKVCWSTIKGHRVSFAYVSIGAGLQLIDDRSHTLWEQVRETVLNL